MIDFNVLTPAHNIHLQSLELDRAYLQNQKKKKRLEKQNKRKFWGGDFNWTNFRGGILTPESSMR